MIDFPRSCFCVVAMLLRQRAGGRIVGFVALLHAVSGLLLYTAVLLFLRGFARDTVIGSVLDVPVIVPMSLFTVLVVVVWAGRSIGLLRYAGPLRLTGPNEGFTGHAGEPLRGRFGVEHEWTLLERHEPTALAVAGVLLGLIPWTRAIGLYLLLAAAADAWQTARDRRANVWEHDPEADFATPLGEVIASGEGVEIAFDSLGEVSILLDEDAAARARSHAASDSGEPEGFLSVAPGVAFKPRGPISVHHRPRATPVFLAAVLVLVGNFAIGDVAGLYDRAPERWTAGVESLESAGVAYGLLRPEGETGPGELTAVFLGSVDPSSLGSRQDDKAREAIEPIQQRVTEASQAIASVRQAVRDKLGLELTRESRTRAFNELLLRKESVRDAWATLLNEVPRLEAEAEAAVLKLQAARVQGRDASLAEVREIGRRAEDWKAEASALRAHVDHIDVMLRTLLLERALENSPDTNGG